MSPAAERGANPEAAAAAERPYNPFDRETVEQAVERFGTHYLYDERTIRERCAELTGNIPGEIHYAIKANPNVELLRLLRDCDLDAEAVSQGEVHLALEAGFAPDQIVYTCGYAGDAELRAVAREGIHVHADSLHQVAVVADEAPEAGVSVRLNQGIGGGHHEHVFTGGPDSKFGILPGELDEARRLARERGSHLDGLHQHIGSEIRDPELLMQAVDALIVSSRYVDGLKRLDFGGGFGVPYRPGEQRLDVAAFGALLRRRFATAFRWRPIMPRLAFEPGRYPVAEAGVLNTQVTDVKRRDDRTFVGIGTGFNHSPRVAMYGAYHHIENVTRPDAPREPAVVVGNVCESGDRFTMADGDQGYLRDLSRFEIGDTVSLLTHGAYVEAMASEFNSRAKPPSVLYGLDGKFRRIG